MGTGTSVTTNDGTWVATADAVGFPTVAGSGGCTVYRNNSPSSIGIAYTTILPFTDFPAGATVTNCRITFNVQSDGTSFNGVTHVAPLAAFQPYSDGAGTFLDTFWGIGAVGAAGVGDLPFDTSIHTITYDNAVYTLVSGGGGIFNMDLLVAAANDTSDPLTMVVRPQNCDTGGFVRWYDPVTIEVDWLTTGATVQPPLRQYPRTDGLGASGVRRVYPAPRSQQNSNRRAGGYL